MVMVALQGESLIATIGALNGEFYACFATSYQKKGLNSGWNVLSICNVQFKQRLECVQIL